MDGSGANNSLALLTKDDHQDTELGAVMYIIAVLTFYSLALVVMIVKYLKTERKEMEEEIQLEKFFKGIPSKRIEHERDAVNRVAIHAFHTLTAARGHGPDSVLNSARSSYTEHLNSSRDSDDHELHGYPDDPQTRRASQHSLHPYDRVTHAHAGGHPTHFRRGSHENLGQGHMCQVTANALEGHLNGEDDYRLGTDGESYVQFRPSDLADDGCFSDEEYGRHSLYSPPYTSADGFNEREEAYNQATPFLQKDRNANAVKGYGSERVTPAVSTSERGKDRHVMWSSNDMDNDSDGCLQSPDRAAVFPSKNSEHSVKFQVVNETAGPHVNPRSTKQQKLDRTSAPPRSHTSSETADDSCASCLSTGRSSDQRDHKKKEKSGSKSRVRIPQISITRSSTSGDISVPAIDYKIGKSHHTSAESAAESGGGKNSGKGFPKPAKRTLFARSSASKDKKSGQKGAAKHAQSKNAPEKELSKPGIPESYSSREADQAVVMSDTQSYDSSSSLLPRGDKGNTSDDSPANSPVRVLNNSAAQSKKSLSFNAALNSSKGKRESLPPVDMNPSTYASALSRQPNKSKDGANKNPAQLPPSSTAVVSNSARPDNGTSVPRYPAKQPRSTLPFVVNSSFATSAVSPSVSTTTTTTTTNATTIAAAATTTTTTATPTTTAHPAAASPTTSTTRDNSLVIANAAAAMTLPASTSQVAMTSSAAAAVLPCAATKAERDGNGREDPKSPDDASVSSGQSVINVGTPQTVGTVVRFADAASTPPPGGFLVTDL